MLEWNMEAYKYLDKREAKWFDFAWNMYIGSEYILGRIDGSGKDVNRYMAKGMRDRWELIYEWSYALTRFFDIMIILRKRKGKKGGLRKQDIFSIVRLVKGKDVLTWEDIKKEAKRGQTLWGLILELYDDIYELSNRVYWEGIEIKKGGYGKMVADFGKELEEYFMGKDIKIEYKELGDV